MIYFSFDNLWCSFPEKFSESVAGRIMPRPPPSQIHVLIPRICEYVVLKGKVRVKAANLLTLKQGDDPQLPWWVLVDS